MSSAEPLVSAALDKGLQSERKLLLSFLGLNALAGLSVGVAKVILSLYAVALEADAVQLGLIACAQSIGILLMSLPAGVMVDLHGPLRLFTIGTLVSGGLYLAMPLIDSASLLCLLILLISCFMPLRIVSLSAMFMQQIGRVGVGMAGWFRATHMVGMLLLGPLTAAALLETFGFAGSYLTIGATFFLLVLLAPGVLRHYKRPQEQRRPLSVVELKAQLLLLGSDGLLRYACLREFCIQAVNQFYTFFIVVVAIQSFHFERAGAAGLISAQGTSFVLALLVMGRLALRLHEQAFFRAGCGVIGAALLILGFTDAAWGLWLGGVSLGWGLGMLQIVNISWFAKIGSQRGQGRIAGLTTFVGPAGGLVGSAVGGTVGHWLGLQWMFVLMAGVFVLFLVSSFRRSAHPTTKSSIL